MAASILTDIVVSVVDSPSDLVNNKANLEDNTFTTANKGITMEVVFDLDKVNPLEAYFDKMATIMIIAHTITTLQMEQMILEA